MAGKVRLWIGEAGMESYALARSVDVSSGVAKHGMVRSGRHAVSSCFEVRHV